MTTPASVGLPSVPPVASNTDLPTPPTHQTRGEYRGVVVVSPMSPRERAVFVNHLQEEFLALSRPHVALFVKLATNMLDTLAATHPVAPITHASEPALTRLVIMHMGVLAAVSPPRDRGDIVRFTDVPRAQPLRPTLTPPTRRTKTTKSQQ